MIFVSPDNITQNHSRWLPAGKNIREALSEFTAHRITAGTNTISEGNCYIEDAVTIGEFVFLGNGTHIGNHTVIGDNAITGDGVVIGRHCIIQEKAIIGRRCKVGEFSFIGSGTELADDVNLPPHSVCIGRKIVTKTEKLAAVISTGRKIEAFFGSDPVFVYETDPDPSLENDMTFAEFIKEARIVKLSDVLKKRDAEQKLLEISRLVTVLQNIAFLK